MARYLARGPTFHDGTPDLLVMGEPTPALATVVAADTIDLLEAYLTDRDTALLLITYYLGYAAAFADDIAVLRACRIRGLTPLRAFVDAPQIADGRTMRDAAFALGGLFVPRN